MNEVSIVLHQILCSIEQDGVVTSSFFVDSTKDVEEVKALLDEMLEVMAYHIINKNDVKLTQTISFKLIDDNNTVSNEFIESSVTDLQRALIISIGMIRAHSERKPIVLVQDDVTTEILDGIMKKDTERFKEVFFGLRFASEEDIKKLSKKLAERIGAGIKMY